MINEGGIYTTSGRQESPEEGECMCQHVEGSCASCSV
jgi:hypothetical protein